MKLKRHAKILDLISEYSIDTQEELLRLLRQDGFDVTQATVSRDIKELRLLKTLSAEGKYKYTTGTKNTTDIKNHFSNLFENSVISIDCAQNIIILKTMNGMAMAVCAALDAMNYESIAGTIAGDDTIFAVCRTNQMAIKLVSDFKKLI